VSKNQAGTVKTPHLERNFSLSVKTLDALEHEYGDSFYLVDLDAFAANYHEFINAFREFYPNTNIAYSYKTNYTPRLCQIVDHFGGYAEVVSRMEYDLARSLGVEPRRIIFNGPYKTQNDIELALKYGSIVNLDWPYQIDAVSHIARNFSGTQMRVGLRVAFTIPPNGSSRFGFNAEELGDVFKTFRELDNVEIAGLHCHFLTRKRSVDDYRFIAERMLALTVEHFPSAPPRFINLGGGFFSKMKEALRAQFGFAVPSYGQYAQAIAPQLAAHYPNGEAPELILEPGICLTADVAKFVARVIDVNVIRVRKLALVSGSIYDIKPTLNSRNLPIEVVRGAYTDARRINGKLDIVGYTCMEHDVLFAGFEGELAAGDYVVFDNVGAYTNVLRPPFIRECPPMLGWSSKTNTFEVLKRKEAFNDVFKTYAF